jgi:hypothetical protein
MGRVDAGVVLYDIGAVADAIQCPVRRLESWVEQQILEPVADASGPGTRRKFDFATAVKAGILNELRWLLGPHFRPGEVGRYFARLGPYSHEWRFFGDRPDRTGSMLVVLYRDARRRTLAAAFIDSKEDALARIARHGALVVINIDEIAARVRMALRV